MKIIGFDPGFAGLGWVEVEVRGSRAQRLIRGGVHKTKPSAKRLRVRAVDDNVRRTRNIARGVGKLIDSAALVCIEAITFGGAGAKARTSTAGKQGMCVGAIVALCEAHGKPLLQATPQEIKKTICGKASASKGEITDELSKVFPNLGVVLAALNKGDREHCSDALGAVVACLDTEEARLCLTASANSTSPR